MYDILPDGSFALLFVLSGSRCRVLYIGPFTELRRVPLPAHLEYFCVQFRPGKMSRIIDAAAADLVNSWVELPNVLGTTVDALCERLHAARGIDAKRLVAETFFRKADVESYQPKSAFIRCAEAVDASGGIIRVDELANQAGVTARTLERMFREQTGMPPKTFIRMVRFQKAFTKLRNSGPSFNLAALACDCGYTDQSHFIRDFKELAQRLPGSF